MLVGLRVLRFRGVNEAEQFVNFENLWLLARQILKSSSRLREFAGVVLRDRRLECTVEILVRFAHPLLGSRQHHRARIAMKTEIDQCFRLTVFAWYHRSGKGGGAIPKRVQCGGHCKSVLRTLVRT